MPHEIWLPLGYCMAWDPLIIFSRTVVDLALWAAFLLHSASILWAWYADRVASFTHKDNALMWAAASFAVAMTFFFSPALIFLPAYPVTIISKGIAAGLYGFMACRICSDVMRPVTAVKEATA